MSLPFTAAAATAIVSTVPSDMGSTQQGKQVPDSNQAPQASGGSSSTMSVQQQRQPGAANDGPFWLRWLTRNQATNRTMLLTRTYNKLQGLPSAHNDYLAPLLRDELMPVQSWLIKHLPLVRRLTRKALEHPKYGVPGVINFVDGRTGWMDAGVEEALTKHGIEQVVAIAAGYDTRAYRFGRPNVSCFEIDLPSASTTKQVLVEKVVDKSLPRPVYIAADLSVKSLREALDGSGFDASKKTMFTIEGLIYYLSDDAVNRLFADVTALAVPGSRIIFDFLDLGVLDGRKRAPGFKTTARSVANKGEPFLSGLENTPEAVAAFAASHGGWAVAEYKTSQQLVEAYMPHLKWPEYVPSTTDASGKRVIPKGRVPPPMLMFFAFAVFERA